MFIGLIFDDMEASKFVYHDCSLFIGNRFFHEFGYGVLFTPNTKYSTIDEINKIIAKINDEIVIESGISELLSRHYEECGLNEDQKDYRFVRENVTFTSVRGLWIILACVILLGVLIHIGLLIFRKLRGKPKNFKFKGPTGALDARISKEINDFIKKEMLIISKEIQQEVEDTTAYILQMKKLHNIDFTGGEKLKLLTGTLGVRKKTIPPQNLGGGELLDGWANNIDGVRNIYNSI